MKRFAISALAALAMVPAQAAITVVGSSDANALASNIAGSGITISNATFSSNGAAAGTFTGGASVGLGIDAGIVLTTGTLDCIPGPNNQGNCTGGGTTTTLSFDFVSDTGKLYFTYQFGSEEYNEWVGSQFNDTFQLLLNGTNIALVPGGGGIVSINNVNLGSNAGYYINNDGTGALNMQYDGFTTTLVATADVIAGQSYHFDFTISDLGDSAYDSGVFIKAGSFSGNPTPAPASLALVALGLLGLSLRKRS